MPMDKELKSTLFEKTKSFCKHCTLHGVYYFYKASSWSAHLLWAMIIAASMALCCFLGHMIWEKFVIDPTLTVVETTHYSMVNIPFPAVTICDTDNVFLPKTKEITDLLFFSLTPQSFFDVNIYVWAIDSSSYVKALPLSGRKCILDTVSYSDKIK
ncbi:unnamed protein product [Spodoptera littoralis]|uniref:Uncharacterized protein n=1 Tax=Spodoptera littoralis TaxID=7109 RepID=A0A9P0ID75_SPOLI|nr:unnamed protein product [Spodoptera littoralis]CAH1644605.1 unnamed protein product [Spodoptera littoralis]